MTDYLKTLDEPALQALGIEGFSYGYRDKVRFHELDALNHVNNVNYLRWFETLRVQYVQDYGITSFASEEDPQIVVRRITTDYLAPVLQNQEYVIAGSTRLVKDSSFIIEYGIYVEGRKVAGGDAVCVCLTADGTKRQSHRKEAVENMITRDGAQRG